MKRLLLALISACCVSVASAQSTATNFTATDCNSVSHTLFNDLDAGKIVVLVWVMPCGSCISDARAAYDAVQSFASSHPGKVLYYLSDDQGNTTCASLNSWAGFYGIGSAATTFSNSGDVIKESDYGGSGMPHVVVMGGTNHKIFLNLHNGANHLAEITNAISSALNPTSVGQVNAGNSDIVVYPNPASASIHVDCTLRQAGLLNLDIFDVRGVKVQSYTQYGAAGRHTVNVPLNKSLSNGYYILRMSASGTSGTAGFTVTR